MVPAWSNSLRGLPAISSQCSSTLRPACSYVSTGSSIGVLQFVGVQGQLLAVGLRPAELLVRVRVEVLGVGVARAQAEEAEDGADDLVAVQCVQWRRVEVAPREDQLLAVVQLVAEDRLAPRVGPVVVEDLQAEGPLGPGPQVVRERGGHNPASERPRAIWSGTRDLLSGGGISTSRTPVSPSSSTTISV